MSNSSLTPDSYLVRQHNIITNETPFNGRVNLEEPENPDARFQMFERVQSKNKATDYRDPLKGDIEETVLSKVFFSAGNIQIIQNGFRKGYRERFPFNLHQGSIGAHQEGENDGEGGEQDK